MNTTTDSQARQHLRIGWWSLLFFLSLGVFLEALHGFKVQWYLSVANETRRLMLTLGHAHGTLLALVQIAFAATLNFLPDWNSNTRKLAGTCLNVGTVLIPAGFILGGLKIYGGDPGLGIILVPVGALALFAAVYFAASAASAKSAAPPKGK